ncbi:MAG: pseudouridine synthase [Betaproteobacteria bacterium]|nr:pseudouridine synthase [Betaproteobacteria bacterium]
MPRYSFLGRPLKTRPEDLEDRSEKLHKLLAGAGIGSRRDMEVLIESGRVSINGEPAKVGDRVKPTDLVKVNGRVVRLPWKQQIPRVLIYHKPEGEIVSREDPEGRPSVFAGLPTVRNGRWISVGRLDFNTEGLLIFTTSGDLAERLSHPRYEVEREYAVRLLGALDAEKMDLLVKGVQLDDGIANIESIVPAGGEGVNQWYRLVIREGRNREVRRIMEAIGMTVSRLIRVRFGPVALPPRLKRGMREEMPEDEVHSLMRWCNLEKPDSAPPRDMPDPEERAEPEGSAAPSRIGHPYRRRLRLREDKE